MNDSHEDPQPEPGAEPPLNEQSDAGPVPQPGSPYQAPRPEPAYASGPAPQQGARFFVWIRSLGVRRGSSRWVGGVCSGLAEKWGIDPVIVRGLAVVLTLFFGIGLLAYGVAWALLPEPDGRIHVEQVARGHWSTGMTGAGIATFLGLAGPGQGIAWNWHGGWFPWPVLWVAAIVACVVWAMNRGKDSPSGTGRQPRRQYHYGAPAAPVAADPAQTYAPAPETGPHGPARFPADRPGDGERPTEPLNGSTPSWSGNAAGWSGRRLGSDGPLGSEGPLGASGPLGPSGPLALKARPRLGAAASLMSVGLAVMVGALVLILNSSGVLNLHGYQVAAAAAAAAITAGLAIMASGIRGRSAGGVGTFAVIALVFAGLLSMVPLHAPWTSMANQSWAPTTVSAAQDGLSVAMADASIDLTGLDAGAPLASDLQIPVNVLAAKAVVKVPANIPVTIKSELVVSTLQIQGRPGTDGKAVVQASTTHVNPDATGNGLVVTLQGAAANVTIIPVAGK